MNVHESHRYERVVTSWNGKEWSIRFGGVFELPIPDELRSKKELGTLELHHDKWLKENEWWIGKALSRTPYYPDIWRGTILTELYGSIKDVEEILKTNDKYKDILRHFASCDLYKYEDIGEPYRVKYIDPVLKKLNNDIEQFNSDLQIENELLIKGMRCEYEYYS